MARSINCYDCGAVKENPSKGYCRACNRKRDKEWRVRTGRSIKNRTGLCQCGQPFASYSHSYCSQCASQKRREYLERNPDVRRKMYEKSYQKADKSKAKARSIVSNCLKRGWLVKLPCEVCGELEKVEAHHDDYTKPLDVRWLCKKHHVEHHMNSL